MEPHVPPPVRCCSLVVDRAARGARHGGQPTIAVGAPLPDRGEVPPPSADRSRVRWRKPCDPTVQLPRMFERRFASAL